MTAEVEKTSVPVDGRSIRILELLLVVFVAFGVPLMAAVYIWFLGTDDNPDKNRATLSTLSSIFQELAALAVLMYVLFRQGRGLKDLAFSFEWKDLLRSVSVFLASMIAFMTCYKGTEILYRVVAGHALQESERSVASLTYGMTLVTVLFLIINPFYEELIVRAFVMTDIRKLTGSATLAVVGSVGIQGSYHLYEGLHAALALSAMFLVYALYYTRYKRIMPVILAHLYTDLLALQHYQK